MMLPTIESRSGHQKRPERTILHGLLSDNMESLPFDLSDYRGRQVGFLQQIPDDSLLILPTNPVMARSNDTNFPFRADSYMLYLCGWDSPDAVFIAYKADESWKTSLLVRPADQKAEIWEGRRVGVEGATSGWPVDIAHSIDEMEGILKDLMHDRSAIYTIPGKNAIIDEMISSCTLPVSDPRPILDKMRMLKSPAEAKIMQECANIASSAHIEGMRHAFPGIGEWHLQSILEGHFTRNNSQWAYQSIVGGGDNATILHYNSNNSIVMDGELVLIDAGCEVNGYASDITRTWPVNGSFSNTQRSVYELVLTAQKAGINACTAGSPWISMHKATSEVLAAGLIELGIIDCSIDDALGGRLVSIYSRFFMHGTGHLLGLDVHDVGGGRQGDSEPGPILRPGMVVTVEPGLYFGSWWGEIDVPEEFLGLGVRIEDNILITESDPIVLTSDCPKEISDLEEIVGSMG